MQSVLSTDGPVLHNSYPKPVNSPFPTEEKKRREKRDTFTEAYYTVLQAEMATNKCGSKYYIIIASQLC